MVSGRAVIKDIKQTKSQVESMGGEFKSHYILKDIIFLPMQEKNYNLSDDFVRVRVNIKSNWVTKKVILVRKQTRFNQTGKVDNIVLREEFDTLEEAFEYIENKIPKFEKGFEFEKQGWQYQLGDERIFIEDTQDWKPSVEITTQSDQKLKELFDSLRVVEVVKLSVPEIIRRILNQDKFST